MPETKTIDERRREPWPLPLRVWWVPQIPMQAFYVEVETPAEAVLVCETLARYDRFQYEHRVKPDYSNAGGIQQKEEPVEEGDDGWYDVDDEEVFGEWN